MEFISSENDSKLTETAETLWMNFEKTGSVKDYLLYLQKLESSEKSNPLYQPT